MNFPALIFAEYPANTVVTVTDAATGFAGVNVLEAHQGTAHRFANNTGTKDLTIDFGAPTAVDVLAMVGKYLNGATLEVRASSDNFSASNVQIMAPAVITETNVLWRKWTRAAYRYWRLRFTTLPSMFTIQHACLNAMDPFPCLEDGADLDAMKPEMAHMLGNDLTYMGTTQQNTLRKIKLDFGPMLDPDFAKLIRWANACVKSAKGFFFVPDIDTGKIYFGWLDEKYEFAAPMRIGFYNVSPIIFNTRI